MCAYRKIHNLYKNKDILYFKQAYATEKCHGCLHKDTLIAGVGGYKPIKDIEVGDKVFSYKEETDEFFLTPVINKIVDSVAGKWVELKLENSQKIILTEDHKVLTKNRGWIEAQNLTVNDDIVAI